MAGDICILKSDTDGSCHHCHNDVGGDGFGSSGGDVVAEWRRVSGASVVVLVVYTYVSLFHRSLIVHSKHTIRIS